MRMTERKLSLAELEQNPSICVFDNREETVASYTVIIPTYKRPAMLRFALESGLNQESFSDYEVLVLDNNPERNDGTEQLMQTYAAERRIAYYKNVENIGGVGNWNKLTIMARTDWVVMLHDDDMLYPDFFCVLQQSREKVPNADCIYSSCQQAHFSDGTLQPRQKVRSTIYPLKQKDFVMSNVAGPLVGMAYKRQVLIKLGGFNLDYAPLSDYYFHALLAQSFHSYKMLGYPTTCYRWFENDTGNPQIMKAIQEMGTIIKRELLAKHKFLLSTGLARGYFKVIQKRPFTLWDKCCSYLTIQYFRIPWKLRVRLCSMKVVDHI